MNINNEPLFSFPYHYQSETRRECPHWRVPSSGVFPCKDYNWENINNYPINQIPNTISYEPYRGQITGVLKSAGGRYSQSDEFIGSESARTLDDASSSCTENCEVIRKSTINTEDLHYANEEFHRDGWAVNVPMKKLKVNGLPLDEHATIVDSTSVDLGKIEGGVWKAWKMRFGGDAMCTKCRCGNGQFLTKACDGGDFRNRIGGDEAGEELSIEALIHGYQFSPCCSAELEKWINEQTVGGSGQQTNAFRCGINNCNIQSTTEAAATANIFTEPFAYSQIASLFNSCNPQSCWRLEGTVFVYETSCQCPRVNILGDTSDVYLDLDDEFNGYSGYNSNFEKITNGIIC